jgi:hypothetical protein
MMTPATNTFDTNKDNRLHQEHLIRPRALMTPEQTHCTQRANSITSRTLDKTKRIDATRKKHILQHQDNRLHQEHLMRPRELMPPEANTFYNTKTMDYIKIT